MARQSNLENHVRTLLQAAAQLLKMGDWTFQVSIVEPGALESDADWFRYGECEWDSAERVAQIRITDPTARLPEGVPPFNFDEVLVHELVHVFLDGHRKDTESAAICSERVVRVLTPIIHRQIQKEVSLNAKKPGKRTGGK